MHDIDERRLHLLARAAHAPQAPHAHADGAGHSILLLAAASYGARPHVEATIPTGFDPLAAMLFESIVEGAFLVATADGVFDDVERRAFERIVSVSCDGTVPVRHVSDLVSDLSDQLAEDGLDQRLARVAAGLRRPEHALEVLRIATLVAHVSEDVSDVEREVLVKLAAACGLAPSAVDSAHADVQRALGTLA